MISNPNKEKERSATQSATQLSFSIGTLLLYFSHWLILNQLSKSFLSFAYCFIIASYQLMRNQKQIQK